MGDKICPRCGGDVVRSRSEEYDVYCPDCGAELYEHECLDYFAESAYDFEVRLTVEEYYRRKYGQED